MTIPIASPQISEAAKEAVVEVLDSGMLADGEHVRQFEAAFADYVGTEYAVATSSGTAALHAMLEAAGIGEDDIVVTSPFSFIASANAVVHAGGEPVFADVDPVTFNLDPARTREVIERRGDVTAIMPVHLYGLPADMDEFRELAAEFDLKLFEDAAQAHGATHRGDPVGSLGDAAAFSFYPTKNVTTGEGGMVTTDDEKLAERIRRVVDHGRVASEGGYEHVEVGYNYRMTNVAAAIGREQLRRLPRFNERRRENARDLTDQLHDFGHVETPSVLDDRTHVFHQYTIQVPGRGRMVDELNARGVGYGIYYPRTIPDQPAFEDRINVAIPVARELTECVLSLPVHPGINEGDIDQIVTAIRAGTTHRDVPDVGDEVGQGD